MMISAVILTKNEEKNLGRCLKSLTWCEEILVIDDYSDDATLEIAKEFKTKIFKRNLNDDFAQQRNFGLQKSGGDWVLFIDADEEVPEKLKEEIKKIILKTKANGFYLRRNYFLFGGWLRHGETASVKVLRLGRRGAGEWQRRVDEVWKIRGEIKTLRTPLLHYPHQTVKEHLEHINHRSSINARVFYDQGRQVDLREWLKPIFKFIQNFFLRCGFLDKIPGFLIAVFMSFHSFLVRGKLYLIWKKEGGWR